MISPIGILSFAALCAAEARSARKLGPRRDMRMSPVMFYGALGGTFAVALLGGLGIGYGAFGAKSSGGSSASTVTARSSATSGGSAGGSAGWACPAGVDCTGCLQTHYLASEAQRDSEAQYIPSGRCEECPDNTMQGTLELAKAKFERSPVLDKNKKKDWPRTEAQTPSAVCSHCKIDYYPSGDSKCTWCGEGMYQKKLKLPYRKDASRGKGDWCLPKCKTGRKLTESCVCMKYMSHRSYFQDFKARNVYSDKRDSGNVSEQEGDEDGTQYGCDEEGTLFKYP